MKHCRWRFPVAVLAGLLLSAPCWGVGEAYEGELTAADYRTLQSFYRVRLADAVGQAQRIKGLLARVRDKADRLGKLGKQASCGLDCGLAQEIDRELMAANRAMNEARARLQADRDLLLHYMDIARKGNAAHMEAQARHERRKLGFDMGMIVARTFQMDPGPLMQQLAKDFGAGDGGAGASRRGGSMTGFGARLYFNEKGVSYKDWKRSGGPAVVRELASYFMEGSTPNEQMASSFTQNIATGVWEKINELAKASKPFTPAMLGPIVIEAALNAKADAVGKELEQDLATARRDAARSESMRLLAVAEYKALVGLERQIYRKKGELPVEGLAADVNWEAGHFRSVARKQCRSIAAPPRLSSVGERKTKEFLDLEPPLEQAAAALRRADEKMARLLEKAARCGKSELVIRRTGRFGKVFLFELENRGKQAIRDLRLDFRFFKDGRQIASGSTSMSGTFLVLNPGGRVPLAVRADKPFPESGEIRYAYRWKGRSIAPVPAPRAQGTELEAEVGYSGYVDIKATLVNPSDRPVKASWCYAGIYDAGDQLIAVHAFTCPGLPPHGRKQISTLTANQVLDRLRGDKGLADWGKVVSTLHAEVYVSPPAPR